MRSLLVDLRPLRESPAFRRLWLGGALSGFGGQMTAFAVLLQVFTLTRSETATGAVGLAQAVPGIAFGLFGGALADAMDRRRLVLWATSAQTAISTALTVQAFAGSRLVWPLYTLVALQGTVNAVSGPARRTFLRRLLPADRIGAAAALTMTTGHLSLIAGPALAGVLTGLLGLKICYLVDALSFVGSFWGVGRLPRMVPDVAVRSSTGPVRSAVASIAEGLRFIRHAPALLGALLADVNAMVLGMPIALFPAINAVRFGNHPALLGLLSAALGVGGVLGSVLSGPAGRSRRPGRLMLWCGGVWGAALAAFGLTPWFGLAVVFLVLAGTADVTAVVLRTSMVQLNTPDRLRGRVSAAENIVGALFPQLGNFRAGLVGSLTTPAIGVTSGGLAVIAGALALARLLPAFRGWDPQTADNLEP